MSTAPNITSDSVDPNVGSIAETDLESGTLTEEPETTVDEPAGGSEPEGEISPESEATGEQPAEGDEPGKQDGREIPAHIRALKETNPKAYAAAKGDFFDLRERRSLHPTVKAAREEHDLLESLGGSQGVATLREDSNFFKQAAQQFLKGDGAFTQDLWDEDAIAAALHVSPMLDQFKAHDLEGYKSTIARIWKGEFAQVGFADRLQELGDLISSGKKDDALALLNAFGKWQKSIVDVADKAEDPRVKTLLAERSQRRDDAAKAEQSEFLKSYRTDTINAVVEDGGKIFDDFFKNKKLDDADRTDLLREAFSLANRIVEADTKFVQDRDAHLKSGDRNAAMRLTKARYARELTESVKKVARRYGLISGQPAKQPSQDNKGKNAGTPPVRPAPAVGFLVVNQRPAPEDIDRNRTTNDMIISGRAVLKNGRKVDWSRLKRS